MLSGINNELLIWGILRSLDTRSNAVYDHSGMLAHERLEKWRRERSTDDAVMDEIRSIYAYNPSLRSPEEPIVVVKSDYPAPGTSPVVKVPAVWVSFDDPEPSWKKDSNDEWVMTKPHAMGITIIDIIRYLMALEALPEIPTARVPA